MRTFVLYLFPNAFTKREALYTHTFIRAFVHHAHTRFARDTQKMSGGNDTNGSSAFRDFLLAPDGCAPDDDSSVSQNPIMRLTDKPLWTRRRERVRSGKTDAKRPTDWRDFGRPKATMDGRPGERETREYRRQRRKSTGARAESKVGRHGETSCAGVGKRARECNWCSNNSNSNNNNNNNKVWITRGNGNETRC